MFQIDILRFQCILEYHRFVVFKRGRVILLVPKIAIADIQSTSP